MQPSRSPAQSINHLFRAGDQVRLECCYEIYACEPLQSYQHPLRPTASQPFLANLMIGQSRHSSKTRTRQTDACRQLLQRLLQGIDPGRKHDWAVAYNKEGAPLLLQDGCRSDLQLSFSHSGAYSVAALAKGLRVAVDIETPGARRNYPAMSDYMGWGAECISEQAFLTRWTLWEACAKISAHSSLSKRIPCFDEIGGQPPPGQLTRRGEWQVLPLKLGGLACCTFLLHDSSKQDLELRSVAPTANARVVKAPLGIRSDHQKAVCA